MLQSTKVRRRAYQDRETDERVSWSNDDLRKEAVKSCNAGCGDVDKGVASLPMSGHRRAPVDVGDVGEARVVPLWRSIKGSSEGGSKDRSTVGKRVSGNKGLRQYGTTVYVRGRNAKRWNGRG